MGVGDYVSEDRIPSSDAYRKRVHLFVVHKPLKFTFHKKSGHALHLFHHLDYIGQFITDIQQVSGCDKDVADSS